MEGGRGVTLGDGRRASRGCRLCGGSLAGPKGALAWGRRRVLARISGRRGPSSEDRGGSRGPVRSFWLVGRSDAVNRGVCEESVEYGWM